MEEALDRTMWIARIGRGFGPVVRQTAKWMNEMQPDKSFFKESSSSPSRCHKTNFLGPYLFLIDSEQINTVKPV
jgi:hypothetical protein